MKLKGRLLDLHLDFITHKPKLILELKGQDNLGEYDVLKEEEILDIEITKHKEKRSNDANAYFHVLVNKLARHFDISDEEMKIKMNLQYGTIATDENEKVIGCKVPKGVNVQAFYPYSKWYKEDADGCDCYLFYKRTHTLNTLEFSKLIKGVEWECKQFGIKVLDDIEFEKMMKEYDKEFKSKGGNNENKKR